MCFHHKKIILAITSDNDFYKCFEDNLKTLGFTSVIILRNLPFTYKKKSDQVFNFVRKTILKDKEYKKKLIQKYDSNTIEQKKVLVHLNDKVDYSLTIRADLFSESILKKIVSKSKKAYAYQWDGLDRYPTILSRLNVFDKFYVFDKNDTIKDKKTYPLTNFYFDCYSEFFENNQPNYDVYYLGSYDSRIEQLIKICELLHDKGLKLNINIPCSKEHQKILSKYSYIKFPKRGLTYKQNIENIANARIILDFHNGIHNGLSFRAFEALGYSKKLITTNQLITDYDFYNESNIHVYKNDEKSLLHFLQQPMVAIDKKTQYKYSFTNWLSYVLELDDAIKIDFPS